jgi:hypothetical protein
MDTRCLTANSSRNLNRLSFVTVGVHTGQRHIPFGPWSCAPSTRALTISFASSPKLILVGFYVTHTSTVTSLVRPGPQPPHGYSRRGEILRPTTARFRAGHGVMVAPQRVSDLLWLR